MVNTPSRASRPASASPIPRSAVIGRCSGGRSFAGLAVSKLTQVEYAIDLDMHSARQLRHSDGHTRGIGCGEIRGHDLVDFRVVRKVRKKDRHPHGVRKRPARRFGNGFEVIEYAADFRIDAAGHQLARGGVECDLAREVDSGSGAYRLGIRADGFRGVGSRDDLTRHGYSGLFVTTVLWNGLTRRVT